jgi:hypothetical protein
MVLNIAPSKFFGLQVSYRCLSANPKPMGLTDDELEEKIRDLHKNLI